MAVAPNGDLYIAGEFDGNSTLTVSMLGVGRWDGSAWYGLGTGLDDSVAYNGLALAIDAKGYVYVGGTFDTADGVTAANVAMWNGRTFEPLGAGTNDSVLNLAISDDGLLYAAGNFTTAGGLTVDRLAIWNGSTWVYPPLDLPGAPAVYAIKLDGDNIYLGYDTAGTASTSVMTTVTNSGTAIAYPVLHVGRSGGTSTSLQYLKNETTVATVYFKYALLDGETLTVDFRPGQRSVISSYFGEVVGRAVLRGSDISEFYLLPGANSISLYIANSGATLTSYLTWRTTHEGADGAAA
jgi:hypothetical protein